jgi:uncharacterized membrane protein YphA (DoxX/SURF4 family)
MKNLFSSTAEPKIPLSWVALLRILMGVLFLTTWASNLFKGFYTPDGLQVFFTEVFPQSENPLGLYAAFINGVILPIRGVFAPFQLISELVMSLALLAGAFTPFFSLAGIIFLVNTFLATLGQDWPWAYLMPITILAVVFFTRAGRVWGLDALLLKRYGDKSRWLW